jgi:hypothetical protein
MQHKRLLDQPDLFLKHRPNRQARISEETGLIQLLGALLLETLSGKAAVTAGKEGDDEQDHA